MYLVHSKGTYVFVTHLDPLHDVLRRGCIVGVTQSQLRIAFHEPFNLNDGQLWRLDVSSTAIAYERMRAAVVALRKDPADQPNKSPLQYHSLRGQSRDTEGTLQGTYLRDVLLSGFREGKHTSTQPPETFFAPDAHLVSWARRYSRTDPVVVLGDPNLRSRGLNETQIRAVAVMLGGTSGSDPSPPSAPSPSARKTPHHGGENRIALVHGPPGTGKTRTVIETVRLLKQHFCIPHPILLCTYTNVAVDNLVEGLVAPSATHTSLPSSRARIAPRPLRALRVGSPGKVRPSLRPHTLEVQMAAHPDAKELENVADRVANIFRRRKDLGKRIEEMKQKAAALAYEHEHEDEHVASTKKWIAAHLKGMEMDFRILWSKEMKLRARLFDMRSAIMNDVVRSADVVRRLSFPYPARKDLPDVARFAQHALRLRQLTSRVSTSRSCSLTRRACLLSPPHSFRS